MPSPCRQTLPFLRDWGADPVGNGRWRFSLWAPDAETVTLELGGTSHPMARYAHGFWRVEAAATAGDSYQFHADGHPLPDPAARAQQDGVTGLSVLVDPAAYRWASHWAGSDWAGRDWAEAVIYELHIGTFTAEGTFAAAARDLPRLAGLGITCIELMPVAQFPGRAAGAMTASCPSPSIPPMARPTI